MSSNKKEETNNDAKNHMMWERTISDWRCSNCGYKMEYVTAYCPDCGSKAEGTIEKYVKNI